MLPAAMSAPAEVLITVRRARPSEWQELHAIQCRASLALEEYREQLIAHPDAIELPFEQVENGSVMVAELDGRLAGFAAVLVEHGHAELDGLFVEPDLWGRHIGTALVTAAVHEARRHGLAMMVTAGPSARGFYEKCGFALEGEASTRFGPALRMSN